MASTKISIFVNLALVAALFLMIIISTAESRSILGDVVKASSTLSCDSVIGVKKGDTCLRIEMANNVTSTFFNAINPNLNCTAIFVGQWLCIDGTIN